MNPRLYFDEKTLKKLGDVFVVNTYFPIKTVPDSADYFLLVYMSVFPQKNLKATENCLNTVLSCIVMRFWKRHNNMQWLVHLYGYR